MLALARQGAPPPCNNRDTCTVRSDEIEIWWLPANPSTCSETLLHVLKDLKGDFFVLTLLGGVALTAQARPRIRQRGVRTNIGTVKLADCTDGDVSWNGLQAISILG